MNPREIVVIRGSNGSYQSGGNSGPHSKPGILTRIFIAVIAVGILAVAFFFAFFFAAVACMAVALFLIRHWFRKWRYGKHNTGDMQGSATAPDGTRTWFWGQQNGGMLQVSFHATTSNAPLSQQPTVRLEPIEQPRLDHRDNSTNQP
ncbi:MAG TPA: hypothetical protein DIT89_05750 [Planctomycetaceae bacterium]|nr:hypothetical protein [Planctomycetaceae bacterium]